MGNGWMGKPGREEPQIWVISDKIFVGAPWFQVVGVYLSAFKKQNIVNEHVEQEDLPQQ